MSKIIITEKQFNNITKKLLSERLGVPDFILDSANTLYELVADYLKNITEKQNSYTINEYVQLPIGNVMINKVEININVEELDEQDETQVDLSIERDEDKTAKVYNFRKSLFLPRKNFFVEQMRSEVGTVSG